MNWPDDYIPEGFTPYHIEDAGIIFNCDCRDILPKLPKVDLVLTDPPYPNGVGHFDDSIETAIYFLKNYNSPRFMVFWHQLEIPPVPMPLIAHHIWFRTNTNRPDNYEAIYEFAFEEEKSSKVFPYPVIYPGLTGCHEATVHPTQKNLKLIKRLIEMRQAVIILDPFLGSGTTAVAAKELGRKFIGIEISEEYCKIAVKRLRQGVLNFD